MYTEFEKHSEFGELNHPRQLGPDAPVHKSGLVLWHIQKRSDGWGYYTDHHDHHPTDAELATNDSKLIFPKGLDRQKMYVAAYRFGQYPRLYELMRGAGIEVISTDKAEVLLA